MGEAVEGGGLEGEDAVGETEERGGLEGEDGSRGRDGRRRRTREDLFC